jgi:5,10-methylenetetrahydromethanopterin reductase
MEVSCSLPPGPRTVEYAALAERLGYRRVWLLDSPALYADVWATMARCADRTERIGIAAGVLVPGLRHVMTTAAAIATIEEIAPGRVAVAIGTGFTGRHLLGEPVMRWSDVASYIRQLRGLLHGDDVEVDGRVLRMCQTDGWAPPRPIRTPVLVAANGPMGLAVAKELGDGVMSMQDAFPFEWCACCFGGTVLDEGEERSSARAFDAVAPLIAFTYHYVYQAAGPAVDAMPEGARWRAAVEQEPEATRHLAVHGRHLVALTDADRVIVGPELVTESYAMTRDEVRARIDGLAAAGATEIVYGPMGSDVPRELRAMARAAGLVGT